MQVPSGPEPLGVLWLLHSTQDEQGACVQALCHGSAAVISTVFIRICSSAQLIPVVWDVEIRHPRKLAPVVGIWRLGQNTAKGAATSPPILFALLVQLRTPGSHLAHAVQLKSSLATAWHMVCSAELATPVHASLLKMCMWASSSL